MDFEHNKEIDKIFKKCQENDKLYGESYFNKHLCKTLIKTYVKYLRLYYKLKIEDIENKSKLKVNKK